MLDHQNNYIEISSMSNAVKSFDILTTSLSSKPFFLRAQQRTFKFLNIDRYSKDTYTRGNIKTFKKQIMINSQNLLDTSAKSVFSCIWDRVNDRDSNRSSPSPSLRRENNAELKWNHRKKSRNRRKQSRTQRRRHTLFLTDKLRCTSGNFAASSITQRRNILSRVGTGNASCSISVLTRLAFMLPALQRRWRTRSIKMFSEIDTCHRHVAQLSILAISANGYLGRIDIL